MQCPICLAIPTEPTRMSCCGNTYCTACIGEWTKIRSVCPLCIAPTGPQKINLLLKKVSSEGFDDGSLVLDAQIQQIRKSIAFNEKRVGNKRQQYHNRKSMIPSSVMQYLEKQLAHIKDIQLCMDEHHGLQHRGATVEYMQLLVEGLLELETALENNCVMHVGQQEEEGEGWEQGQEEEEEEEGDSYDEYEEYEYEVNIGDRKSKEVRNRKYKAAMEGKTKA